MNLAAVDLNLLVALDALLAERSVTRAAARVGLSQPAMSNALARLRRMLDDPVLIRTARGMQPTARSEALAAPIRAALAGLERALGSPRFDPAQAERTFTLAGSDYTQIVLLPALMTRLSAEAPGVELHMVTLGPGPFARLLDAGDVDLAIGQSQESAAVIRGERLFRDRFCCLVRRDHPRIGSRIGRRQFRSERFVGVRPPGALPWSLGEVFEAHGLERRFVLMLSSRLVAALVVAHSDLVAMAPEKLARSFTAILPLRMLRPPVRVPAVEVCQYWHERETEDPAHRWLRTLVAEVAARL